MTAPSQASFLVETREQRAAARRRVLLSGKIVFNAAGLTVDCAIRDLSATGAKVRLSGPVPLPQEVFLIEMKSGVAFLSRVAWRRQPDIGLEFKQAHPLADATDPRLAPMKRIWLEHLAR